MKKKTLKTCKSGHKYYKSSDCPTCEQERKPQGNFLELLPAPARRTLENNGITSLEKLTKYSEKEILALHGMGKSSIPKLQEALAAQGLAFKK